QSGAFAATIQDLCLTRCRPTARSDVFPSQVDDGITSFKTATINEPVFRIPVRWPSKRMNIVLGGFQMIGESSAYESRSAGYKDFHGLIPNFLAVLAELIYRTSPKIGRSGPHGRS